MGSLGMICRTWGRPLAPETTMSWRQTENFFRKEGRRKNSYLGMFYASLPKVEDKRCGNRAYKS